MRNICIEKTELNNLYSAMTKIKNFKFWLIFLHFNFQFDTSWRKDFLNFLSTWAYGIKIQLFIKSNDPTVITTDYDIFKLYLICFDEVLILKYYSRKACFDNAPEELSTF